LLWLSPFVLLALGGAAIVSYNKGKRAEKPAAPLSADESEKLKNLLGDPAGGGHA
jgi:cytochrome c-type biogenesis protein CcmH/NrfF